MDDAVADRIAGCLLGGAIGDAMGAGIEFMSIDEIRSEFGALGVTGYVPAYRRYGAITDDTQMSLFTAEGLIRASVRQRTSGGTGDSRSIVRRAYLRWLCTQQPDASTLGGEDPADILDGWLIEIDLLHRRRAPGTTCESALLSGGHGRMAHPINDSMGCGGVMRAAPAGFPVGTDAQRFVLGCEVAALTHGHPNGHLPAGYLAVAVGALIDGADMGDALDRAESSLRSAAHSESTLAAVVAGRRLGDGGLPAPEAVEELGGGWVGHEALAIGVACATKADNFRSGILAAVNHSGDSDSTGSIAGNLLGAAGGVRALPAEWLVPLELRDVVERVAGDAAVELRGDAPSDEHGRPTAEWLDRYPPS